MVLALNSDRRANLEKTVAKAVAGLGAGATVVAFAAKVRGGVTVVASGVKTAAKVLLKKG